jgi:hypothetical protein
MLTLRRLAHAIASAAALGVVAGPALAQTDRPRR